MTAGEIALASAFAGESMQRLGNEAAAEVDYHTTARRGAVGSSLDATGELGRFQIPQGTAANNRGGYDGGRRSEAVDLGRRDMRVPLDGQRAALLDNLLTPQVAVAVRDFFFGEISDRPARMATELLRQRVPAAPANGGGSGHASVQRSADGGGAGHARASVGSAAAAAPSGAADLAIAFLPRMGPESAPAAAALEA